MEEQPETMYNNFQKNTSISDSISQIELIYLIVILKSKKKKMIYNNSHENTLISGSGPLLKSLPTINKPSFCMWAIQ